MANKNNKIKDDFLNTLKSEKAYGSISAACKLVGISRQTLYNWRQDDYDFDNAVVDAVQEGKSQLADLAEQAIVKRINSGDTTAIIFTLKTLRGNYYGEKDERQQHEKQLNEKSPQEAAITSPGQMVADASISIFQSRYLAERAEVLTPELKEMFEKLRAIINEYREMVK